MEGRDGTLGGRGDVPRLPARPSHIWIDTAAGVLNKPNAANSYILRLSGLSPGGQAATPLKANRTLNLSRHSVR